jgi:putative tricarboxylic transport membrane protein
MARNSGIVSKSDMKKSSWLAIGFAAALSFCSGGYAGEIGWKPTRPVEVVVSQGPGGGTDVVARMIEKIVADQRLSDTPLTVLNKPGGGGSIGLEYVVKRPADGHTIAVGNATLISSYVIGRARSGPSDVTPLTFLFQDYVGFAVRRDSPIRTGKDLLERLKRDPASVSVAIGAAVGNQNHIALVLAARSVGVDPRKLKTVIFKSGAETETALLGGHVDVGLTSSGNFVRHVKAGTLRLIAVAAPQRLQGDLASAPTWIEQGVDSVAGNWYVAYGPKDMPQPQVAYWDQTLAAVVRSEPWKNFLNAKHLSDEYLDSAGTRAFLEQEHARLKRALTELNLAR